MRRYITYVCEYCGKESEDSHTIEACEAADIGLSLRELQEYRWMQWSLETWKEIVKRSRSSEDRKQEEEVRIKVQEFETKHSLFI